MKNTALTDVHIKEGAKMVPFAGYNMPVQYAGINAEHETVRNGVGVADAGYVRSVTAVQVGKDIRPLGTTQDTQMSSPPLPPARFVAKNR